jgi:hypothetical protein
MLHVWSWSPMSADLQVVPLADVSALVPVRDGFRRLGWLLVVEQHIRLQRNASLCRGCIALAWVEVGRGGVLASWFWLEFG